MDYENLSLMKISKLYLVSCGVFLISRNLLIQNFVLIKRKREIKFQTFLKLDI